MNRIWLLVFLVAGASLTVPAAAADYAFQEEPAIVIDDTPPAEEDPAWTFRYLVPALVAFAVVLVAATWVAYYVRIKKRYRVKS